MFNLLFALAITVSVTGYAPSAGGINCDGNCAVTASGLPPQPIIAACGDAWKLGTVLWIMRAHRFVVCGDRFAPGVDPHAVDLYFPTRKDALQWGVRESVVMPIGSVDLWP